MAEFDRRSRVLGVDEPMGPRHPGRFDLPQQLLREKVEAYLAGRPEGLSFGHLASLSLASHRAEAGIPCGGARAVAAALAHTSGDFASVLAGGLNDVFLGILGANASTARRLSRLVNVKRTHPAKITKLWLPALQPLGGGGEIQCVRLDDYGEDLVVVSRGLRFALTRAAVTNDDTASFVQLATAAAQSVRVTENAILWALLLSGTDSNGPTLADGEQFFAAAHNNLLSGAAINATSVGVALAALRNATAPDGTALNSEPAFLVCAPSAELAAKTVVADALLSLEVLAEPALETSGAWYVFADPATLPGVVRGSLSNAPEPFLDSGRVMEIDGIVFKLVADLGFACVDPRGAVKTPAP